MDILERFDNLPYGVQDIIKENVEELWRLEAEEDREIFEQQHKYYHNVVLAELTMIVGANTIDDACCCGSIPEVFPWLLSHSRPGQFHTPLKGYCWFDWGYFHYITDGDFEWVIPQLWEALEDRRRWPRARYPKKSMVWKRNK
jgi:hypothetical protein